MLGESWKSKLIAVLALTMAVGCGKVEGPEYAGEPLATLKGQLTSPAALPEGSGVRLALAWYPRMGESAQGAPQSILTEDVVYEGSFPLNYTFNVNKPPPPGAMADMSEYGGPKKAALGLLIAYEDRNGNGRLDTIPAAGAPIDRVLGSSADMFGGEGFAVVYLEEAGGANADALTKSLTPGFNLAQMIPPANEQEEGEAKLVPLSTSIVIALTADPALNIYVCEALFDPAQEESSFVPCGLEFPQEVSSGIAGLLQIENDDAHVFLAIIENDEQITNATVTVNGYTVPSDEFGSYTLSGAAGTLIRLGQINVVEATVPGQATIRKEVLLPGDFAVTSPSNSANLTSGQPFSASWTASSGAESYLISLAPMNGDSPLFMDTVMGSSFTSTDSIAFTGEAVLTVLAQTPFGGGVFGSVSRTVNVTFAE